MSEAESSSLMPQSAVVASYSEFRSVVVPRRRVLGLAVRAIDVGLAVGAIDVGSAPGVGLPVRMDPKNGECEESDGDSAEDGDGEVLLRAEP